MNIYNILEDMGLVDDEWEVNDTTITCPCGNVTEYDGDFPCDHQNPLIEAGLI